MKTEASNMASKSPPVCPICGSDPCQLGVTIGDKWIFCHRMRRLKHAKFTNVPLCSPKKSSLNALPTLSEPGLVVLTDPDGPDSVTPDRLPCESLGGSQANIVQLEEAPEPVETVSSSLTGPEEGIVRMSFQSSQPVNNLPLLFMLYGFYLVVKVLVFVQYLELILRLKNNIDNVFASSLSVRSRYAPAVAQNAFDDKNRNTVSVLCLIILFRLCINHNVLIGVKFECDRNYLVENCNAIFVLW